MAKTVDLYDTHYHEYGADAQTSVRSETYGEDIGQSSWMSADELRGFIRTLAITPASNVLEVGSGSGGPALFVVENTGCKLVGLDLNEHGVANANDLARKRGLTDRAEFRVADASEALPFADATFDAIVSNDAMCHVPQRGDALREWHRVLKPGGRMLFSDALIVTGLVSHEEIARRSSIGHYFFSPPGENERLIAAAGFELVAVEDATSGAVGIAKRWHDARARHREAMVALEGEENFDGLQRFLWTVHTLCAERRLGRFVYVGQKH
jgi:SAM-dependent methyltransferase